MRFFNKKIDVFFISSGRFSCGSKNAVVFHDVNIAILVGADVEKVPPTKASTLYCKLFKKKIEKKIFLLKKFFLINFFKKKLKFNCLCYRSNRWLEVRTR